METWYYQLKSVGKKIELQSSILASQRPKNGSKRVPGFCCCCAMDASVSSSLVTLAVGTRNVSLVPASGSSSWPNTGFRLAIAKGKTPKATANGMRIDNNTNVERINLLSWKSSPLYGFYQIYNMDYDLFDAFVGAQCYGSYSLTSYTTV